MSDSKNDIWFPAKTYGWGWGFPVTWQGWTVFAVYLLMVFAGIYYLLPVFGHWVFLGYIIFLSIVLILVCWAKGEKPKWRWGK